MTRSEACLTAARGEEGSGYYPCWEFNNEECVVGREIRKQSMEAFEKVKDRTEVRYKPKCP